MASIIHKPANYPKLKIGFIVDSKSVPHYQFELAQWCQDHSELTITHLLVMDAPTVSRHSLIDPIVSSFFSAIIWIESLLLKKAGIHSDNDFHSLDTLIPEIIRLKSAPDASGYSIKPSECSIDDIVALGFDVLLMMGTGTIHDDIRNTAKYGVISPCLSDQILIHGGPEGFWEVFFKLDYTGFSVRQLSEEINVVNDIVSGHIRTQNYYSLNRLHIRQKCSHYLKETLTGIARSRQMPLHSVTLTSGRSTYGMPGLFIQAKYITALGYRLMSRVARSMLKLDFKWGVAFVRNDWQNLDMRTAVKIPNPENHFLADPFVVSESNHDYCFLEDYDYSTQKGHIAVYQLHDDHAECLGNALVEPYHLSFPFMFRFQSELYMCPETSRNRQIRVYKCINFPLQWQLHKVLMEDVSAADTMLFERDGRWWMLTNVDVAGTGDYCSELSIFWADSPLSNEWTAHPTNPVFTDAAKGRNAGLLFDATNIYRVAQRQSFDFYGKAFSINRIDQLDEKNYRETEIRSVQADYFTGLHGTHHMHSSGGITVFDILRLEKI